MYGGYSTPISREIAPEETSPPRLISKEDIGGLMEFCHFAVGFSNI